MWWPLCGPSIQTQRPVAALRAAFDERAAAAAAGHADEDAGVGIDAAGHDVDGYDVDADHDSNQDLAAGHGIGIDARAPAPPRSRRRRRFVTSIPTADAVADAATVTLLRSRLSPGGLHGRAPAVVDPVGARDADRSRCGVPGAVALDLPGRGRDRRWSVVEA